MPVLLAPCVVTALRPDPGRIGVTAIDKRPVTGRVLVRPYGLHADVQADREHHGGLDKALYAYAQEDADFWSAALGVDLPPGWFGENLRVEGFDVNSSRVGERWRVGEHVELEVTMPRTPCQTFARWVADLVGDDAARGWVKRFAQERRLGPYLRVVTPGSIAAGDPIEVTAGPADAPTIRDAFRAPELSRPRKL